MKKKMFLCKLSYFLSSDISWSSSFFVFCQRIFWKLHEEHVQSNWKEIWNLIINCRHYWWQLWDRYVYFLWKWINTASEYIFPKKKKNHIFLINLLSLLPLDAGNLLVMVLVSYLGPRVHRPKVIGVGCLIMSLGAFLSVMPQFLMGR